MPELKGLATGVGSFPHKDAEAALDLIFKYTPNIPFWPQLPKRDVRESMLAQYSENLPCIKVSRDGLFFDGENKEKELEVFYERIIAQDTPYFKISPDFASGLHKFYQRLENQDLKNVEFIKFQVVGPFTFAAGLNNEKGVALLHDEVFMQVILKGLAMKALWQINLFKQFGKKMVLFFDEPYLACFGSAYTPINKEGVIKGLTELTSAVKSDNVLLGVHCCGNTDWSLFTEVKNIDIISFDAFSFLDKFILYSEDLKKFINKGGVLCWGLVPTQEIASHRQAPELISRMEDGIGALARKGLDEKLLLDRLLISPSCGLGTLDQEKAEICCRVLSEVSALAQKLL